MPAGHFEPSPHRLHVKTTVRRFSGVAFRLHFEGFNFGAAAPISTVVVGRAAPTQPALGEMEQYGWPPGWDALTTEHVGAGLHRCRQYFTRDGCAAVCLEAPSLSNVGLSVSAWLCSPGHGHGHAIGVTFHHQDEDL